MLIRGVEARPRRMSRVPTPAFRPSPAFVWDRAFAVAALGVAALSVVVGISALRMGHELSLNPNAGVVMLLSSGAAIFPLVSAFFLWTCRRAHAVLLDVLAASLAYATPHYLDQWPYPVAPGSPEASLSTKMQVLGTILLVFAGVIFVWSLLTKRPAPAQAPSLDTAQPRVGS